MCIWEVCLWISEFHRQCVFSALAVVGGVDRENVFFPSAQLCGVVLPDAVDIDRVDAAQRTEQPFLAELAVVHVAHDSVRIILVDGFQLASRLQNKAGRDLTAADGGYQFFQIGNLPDVGTLVDQAPHMDGQFAAVHIICLVAQQIEKLGVDHADEEVEGAVRIAHDEEQRRFLITQRVQRQLIVHGEVTQFLDVEGS